MLLTIPFPCPPLYKTTTDDDDVINVNLHVVWSVLFMIQEMCLVLLVFSSDVSKHTTVPIFELLLRSSA